MKIRLLFCLVVFTLCFGAKKTNAQVSYVWAGGTSGSWTTPVNWRVGGLIPSLYPGQVLTTDIAIVNTSNATISYSGNVTIAELESTNFGVSGITISFTGTAPTLIVTGGMSIAQPSGVALGITFSGSGTASIAGTVNFAFDSQFAIGSGATVTFTGTVNLNNGDGIANMSNAGTLNCSACTVNSTANITNTGTINVTGGGNFSFTGTPSTVTSSGKINITSGTLTFGNDNNSLQNSSGATVTCNSATINLSGAGAFLSNSGTFKATGTTFSFGNDNAIQNSSGATFTTQSSCAFALSTSGSSITNSGTWNDHASTYTLSGQGASIQNTGAGATMKINGTAINFLGSGGNAQVLNNTATFTADSASSITAATFKSNITNSGTFFAGTSGSSCVISLNAQSTSLSNTGTFNLGSTSIIFPTGTTTSITNTSPGVFTLQSDANGSAAIGAFNATATCTGTFNVQRYYQGSTVFDNTKGRWLGRNYRIISSPVNTAVKVNSNNVYGLNYIVGATAGETTTANSTSNAFITGCAGGSTSAGNPSIYLYRESIIPSNATFTSGDFIGITNITNSTSAGTIGASDGNAYSIPVGNGIFFFFRGAATNWSARTAAPYVAPENVTLTSTGNINQQSVTVKDWYNPTSSNLGFTITGNGTGSNTNSVVRGFNMVGNPYPCSIDWNTAFSNTGIARTNINPTIYVFNPVTNQYDTYITKSSSGGSGTGTATNIIASGQGFFVQANAAGASLVFNESAKAATSQLTGSNLLLGTPVQNAVQQTLRLKLITDSLNYDDIVIGFNSNTSPLYNPGEDAMYIPGIDAVDGLSSLSSDNVPLAINYLPLPKLAPQVVKLDVEGTLNGLYTLKRTAIDAIPAIYELWLMDNYKKDSLDIRNNATYAFTIDLADTNSYGKSRFTLVIRQNPALGVHLLNFTATKSSGGAQVVWKTENEQNYTNFTVERSSDGGETYVVVGGFVSGDLGTYSFLDKTPPAATDMYRLKMQDVNGTIVYSNIVTLIYGNGNNVSAGNISVYPNPAGSVINLAINQNNSTPVAGESALQNGAITPGIKQGANTQLYGIKIISITGRVVAGATSSSANWQNNISNLAPGTYIIEVVNNNNNSLIGKSAFVKL